MYRGSKSSKKRTPCAESWCPLPERKKTRPAPCRAVEGSRERKGQCSTSWQRWLVWWGPGAPELVYGMVLLAFEQQGSGSEIGGWCPKVTVKSDKVMIVSPWSDHVVLQDDVGDDNQHRGESSLVRLARVVSAVASLHRKGVLWGLSIGAREALPLMQRCFYDYRNPE